MESGSGIFVHKSRSGAPDFRRTIRMQSTRDVTLIAFYCTCTSVITDIVPVMAVYQAAQKLGYPTLRPNQHKAIKSFMEGHDVFISLPTGCGKSLCFSVLPYAFDYLYRRVGSIVIVISPLIDLMKDQVRDL